jgi:hypothetical protein
MYWQLCSQAFARLGMVITTAYTTLGEDGLLTSLLAEAIWDVYASSWLCVTGLGGESVKLGSGVGSVRKAVCQPGSYLLLPILGLCPRAIVFGHLDGFLDGYILIYRKCITSHPAAVHQIDVIHQDS